MKYFAILKDSLREALDSKVLYVMVGISTLVIILVGSLSFRPLPAEKTMEQFFFSGEGKRIQPPKLLLMMQAKQKESDKARTLEGAMRYFAQFPFRLAKVELLSGEADAPESRYALTVSKTIPKQDPIGILAAFKGDASSELKTVREIFEPVEAAGYIAVEQIEAIAVEDPAKESARFRVVVQGTPMTLRIWAHEPSWIFGAFTFESMAAPLAFQMFILASLVIGIGSWVTVVVGIVITSFFIPNMLRKGTVDLLLVKPIQRWVLLLYKYVGGLTFIVLCTSYALVGIWLVLGLRSGLWPTGSLLLIFTLTFFFCILYSISTLVGVITRSTVTAIMMTIAAYAVLGMAGFAHLGLEAEVKKEEARELNQGKLRFVKTDDGIEAVKDDDAPPKDARRWADSYWVMGSRVFQAISPRTEDLNQLNTLIVYTDFMTGNLSDMSRFDTSERNWWLSLLVASLWIVFFLGVAALWFTLKDY